MALSPEAFTWVADLVRRRSAIQLQPGKEYLVESRLLPLARELTGGDVDAYVARARTSEPEHGRIVEALTTNETSWFRDSSPFTALRTHVLPQLVAARGHAARLRVWSAACSTGQEPYSLAMTLTDALPPGLSFEILATDLSEQVLARARTGRYSQLEVNRGLPAPLMVRYMTRAGAEWQIADALRQCITFRSHNLLDPAPAGAKFDIVFLRNVLIYFDTATKKAILDRVHRVLAADGALVLGAAETTIGIDDKWQRVPVGAGSVYVPARAGAGPALPAPRPAPAQAGLPLPRTALGGPPSGSGSTLAAGAGARALAGGGTTLRPALGGTTSTAGAPGTRPTLSSLRPAAAAPLSRPAPA
ncbi:CheR family methyltransferase, partial [Cellulomonas endophytica]|uniref:CheR family methyltransferase n=1 Tax=Cellulomonas endophytica TaxID=2494735 RepID=UPI0013E96284